MIFHTTIGRHSQHPLGCDYEMDVTVAYEWHEANAHEDASAEVCAVTDDTGNDVHLALAEEVRIVRLIESYHENPVQTVRA